MAETSAAEASRVAEATVRDLSARFPGRVQVHLHPASSLPASITNASSSDVDAIALAEDLPVALVWTVESLKLLRGYGLVGSFTGTLAQFPQQNLFLGFPIQLLPEEVVYLLRRNLAVLVDEAASYRTASKAEVEEIDGKVQEDRRGQQLAAWHERQLLRAKHAPTQPLPQEPTETELQGLPWHYTIPTTSDDLQWYEPATTTTLSAAQHVYPYPATESEAASTALFEHLKARDMWCMNGLRFGGAFAVYPGDPLRYHSHYTAQLLLPDEAVPMTSLVANGRLGTAVKKTHLLCHVDRFHEQLHTALHAAKGQQRRPLSCFLDGTFDTAPSANHTDTGNAGAQQETELASFHVFSLAWAGFGT